MRLRLKIPLIGAIGIAVLVIIGLLMLYQSHILENWVNRYLADKIAAEYNLDVSITEIEGSLVKGFILKDVLIRFYESADTITLAYIPRISIDYSVSDLWRRQWIINSVGISRPEFYFKVDSTGRWRLPDLPRREESDAPPTSWEVKHVSVDGASLDLSWKGRDFKWFDINLISSARSEEGTYTFSMDSLRIKSDDERLRINYARGLATIFGSKLAFQDVNIITDSSRLVFSLARDTEEEEWVKAEIDSSHIHVQDIASFLGANLTGNLDVSGFLYHQLGRTGGNVLLSGEFQKRWFDSLNLGFHYDEGTLFLDTVHGIFLEGCQVEGHGSIDFSARPQVYHLAAEIDSFNLNQIVFNSYETDLNGYLELDARGFRSETMALDLDVRLDESYFDIYHFHRASGQMTVGKEGLYIFPGFQVNYHSNHFQCEGGVDFYGDIDIDCRADLADISDFEHQTFIDLPAGRAEADFSFTGPTNDPDLRAHCTSDSIWIYEFFSNDFATDFFIQSFINRMQGPIIVRCQNGDAWGFPYDSIFGQFTLDSNLLYIDTGCVANEFSRTEVSGVFDFEKYPQELRLDSVVVDLTGRQFVGRGPQSILIDSAGYLFEQINIDASDGHLSFSGRVDYSDSLDIIWEIDNIVMAPWIELLNDSLELSGRLLSVGSIYNTLDNPEFSLQAQIDSLQYEALHLGNLEAFLSYEDSTLLIDSSYLKSPEGIYTAAGDFPINLSLGSSHDFFDDRQQVITITASDKRLDLAAFLLESVEYITGDFTAEIDLTGKPLKPHLNGVCRLKDGTVKLLYLQDKLEQVEIELDMSDRLVTLTKAEGIIPHGANRTPGQVSGKGTILVRDINRFMYALNADATNMPINYELGDVTGLVNAEISVNGETPPLVTGTIKVPHSTYRESFEETGFSLLGALEADKTWDLDLMVEFPSNFWVKNDEIDAEFSGSINILRDAGIYNFLGTLDVIRGKYFFFDKNFKMTPGGQINYDNIKEPDPKLDLEISTRINTRSNYSEFQGDDNYSYELYLAVTGTLKNPIFSGTGDAPISNEDMLLAILGNYRPDIDTLGSNNVLANRITVGGANLLASQFSRLGTRKLGVETFEIYPAMENGFDPLGMRVTIGAYTLPNLYVFGSSYFDFNKGQEVGMEYRLGRYYLFEGRRDESNLYHLNFKLRWEYGNGDDGDDDN